jgi:hypothetical protein
MVEIANIITLSANHSLTLSANHSLTLTANHSLTLSVTQSIITMETDVRVEIGTEESEREEEDDGVVVMDNLTQVPMPRLKIMMAAVLLSSTTLSLLELRPSSVIQCLSSQIASPAPAPGRRRGSLRRAY